MADADSWSFDSLNDKFKGKWGSNPRYTPTPAENVPAERIEQVFKEMGTPEPSPPTKKVTTTPVQQMAIDTMNQMHAAAHAVSPHVNDPDKRLLGEAYETDDPGRWQYKDEGGNFKNADPKKHVMLVDPDDNKTKVYEKTEEGNPVWDRMVGLGRVMGLATIPAARAVPTAAKTAELLRAAQEEGVAIPKHSVNPPGVVKNVIAPLSAKLPGGEAPVARAAGRTAAGLESAAENAATTSTGKIATAEEAGEAARGAIKAYTEPGGVLARRANQFYDRVRSAIPGTAKAEMPNTMATAQKIVNEVEASGRPGITKAVNEVLGAVTQPGGTTFDGMHRLRSDLRGMLRSGSIPEGMVTGDVKRLITSIGDDVKGLAQTHGGQEAVNALDKADKHYALAFGEGGRAEKLEKILGPASRSDEGIFSALQRLASSGAAGDAKTLAAARKAIPAEEWEHITSAAAANLGRRAGNFEPTQFLRQYGAMSEKGKNLLFGEGSEARRSLDNIAKISQHWPEIVGPSAHSDLAHALTTGVGIEAVHEGGVLHMIGAAMTNNLLGRLLTRPATLKNVANWSQKMELAALKPTQGNFAALNRAAQSVDMAAGREFDEPGRLSEFTRRLQREIEKRNPL